VYDDDVAVLLVKWSPFSAFLKSGTEASEGANLNEHTLFDRRPSANNLFCMKPAAQKAQPAKLTHHKIQPVFLLSTQRLGFTASNYSNPLKFKA
jgi:hypothetical protein